MIGRKVAEVLLDNQTLEYYKFYNQTGEVIDKPELKDRLEDVKSRIS